MKLTFFKQGGEPKRIDKSKYLQEVGSIDNVFITEDSDLINPTFVLQTKETVYQSNYVYCDFTKRYYFVNNITAMTGGRLGLKCTCDVLFTYKNEILKSKAWIKTSGTANVEANFDMMHNDYPFQQDYDVLGKDFINGEIDFGLLSADGLHIVLVIK